MKQRLLTRAAIFYLTAICAIFSSAIIARGQGSYPEPADDYVNDFAQVLNAPDAEQIRTMFKNLEYQTGIEAVVVTIPSINAYQTADASIESFATNLFNTWGIGHKRANNGVLILVSVEDRKCRIELGAGYGSVYDAAMKQVIDGLMVPYFKTGDYSRGIFEGARGVIENTTKKISWFAFYKWHILIGVLIIVCVFAGISCIRSGNTGWGWAFFGIAAMLFLFLLKLLTMGKSSSGFGGGSSFGGGASGSW
ncbi:MAG TPA: TPM domain-containing protein [Candidatus Brocadiaceae bacterium]|nr:TPM domain-containing protein [Candidatus Brocadiaceae bacterium]